MTNFLIRKANWSLDILRMESEGFNVPMQLIAVMVLLFVAFISLFLPKTEEK